MDNINLILYNLTPDLLDRGTLIKILNDRCIELPNMNTMSKDVLVELFHRVVAPLPQRTSCSGQPQHSALLPQETRGFSIGFSDATSSSLVNATCSRLKPPPIIYSTQKKVKLTTTKSQCSSYLDNIVINDRRKKISSQDVAEKCKDETNFVLKNGKTATDKIVINNKTNLNNTTGITQTTSSFQKEHNLKPSSSVTEDEEGIVDKSLNLLKPRIKLKRSSLSTRSSLECSSQTLEPEVKKPKTKIVF